MKYTILLFLLFIAACCFNACESFFCPDPDPGFTWEKKDYVFMVPFYRDSLGSDSLELLFFPGYRNQTPEILYSATLDSFRITTDIKASQFYEPNEDTAWSPIYDYSWKSKNLRLDYWFNHLISISTTKNTQSPQCDQMGYVIEITRLKIEVPRTLKYIEITR